MHTEGAAPYAEPAVVDSFHTKVFFVSGNIRQAIAEGRDSYFLIFINETPSLLRSHRHQHPDSLQGA